MFANPDNCSQFFFFREDVLEKMWSRDMRGNQVYYRTRGGEGKKVGREGSMIKLFCIMRALTNPYRSRTVAN